MVPAIEAPLALLQKPIEVVGLDAIVLPHMALGLVPEVLDPIDVVPVIGEEF